MARTKDSDPRRLRRRDCVVGLLLRPPVVVALPVAAPGRSRSCVESVFEPSPPTSGFADSVVVDTVSLRRSSDERDVDSLLAFLNALVASWELRRARMVSEPDVLVDADALLADILRPAVRLRIAAVCFKSGSCSEPLPIAGLFGEGSAGDPPSRLSPLAVVAVAPCVGFEVEGVFHETRFVWSIP